MIIYLYLFILLETLSVESSSIRGRNFKNELVPESSSKMDFPRKSDDNLKTLRQEPFILGTEVSHDPDEGGDKYGKEKKKRPSIKRFSKLKLLGKKNRIRRDVSAADTEVIPRNKEKKSDEPVKLITEKPVKISSNVTSTDKSVKNVISRQDIVKALTQSVKKEKKKSKKHKSIEKENSYEYSSAEDEEGTMSSWLLKGSDSKTSKNLQHQHHQTSDNGPLVRMRNPRHPYHDIIVDRERLEQKIKSLKNLLQLDDSDSSDDGVRVRRKTDSDRPTNKLAKMFLTLSGINDTSRKRRARCRGEEEDVGDVWEEERKNSSSKKNSSSNEQRYKVKKWIEHLKSKRSSRYCPCPLSSRSDESDLFPLERKLQRDYMTADVPRSSEESSETYSLVRPSKNGRLRGKYAKANRDTLDKPALAKAGKKRLELPFEDLEIYRTRAKQILQNAEEILDKIKEEEEKRKSMPNYLMSHLKELTSRIQGDPRNSENDLIRMLQKSFGWSPLTKGQEEDNEGGSFTDNVKSYILQPYEKAKNITEEGAKQLSSYLLKNLGKIGEKENRPQEAAGNEGLKIELPEDDKTEAVKPQIYHGQDFQIKQPELSFDDLKKEEYGGSPVEPGIGSKEPGADTVSEYLPSKSKVDLSGNQAEVSMPGKNPEDKMKKILEDARKKTEEKFDKKDQPEEPSKSEETVAAEHYLKEDDLENGRKSAVDGNETESKDVIDRLIGGGEQENKQVKAFGDKDDVTPREDADDYEKLKSTHSLDLGKNDEVENLKQGEKNIKSTEEDIQKTESEDTKTTEHARKSEGKSSELSKDYLPDDRDENDVLASKHLVQLDNNENQEGTIEKSEKIKEDGTGKNEEDTVAAEHVTGSSEGSDLIQAKKIEEEMKESNQDMMGAKHSSTSGETVNEKEEEEKDLVAIQHSPDEKERESSEKESQTVDETNKDTILASQHSLEDQKTQNEDETLTGKSKEEEVKSTRELSPAKDTTKQGLSGEESSENESTSQENVREENAEKVGKTEKGDKSLENEGDGTGIQSESDSNVVEMPDNSKLSPDSPQGIPEDDVHIGDLTKDDAIVREENVQDELLQMSDKKEDLSEGVLPTDDATPTSEFIANQNPEELEKLSHTIENVPELEGTETELEKSTDNENVEAQPPKNSEEMRLSDVSEPDIMTSRENLDWDIENDKAIVQAENPDEEPQEEKRVPETDLEKVLQAITKELMRQESGERYREEEDNEDPVQEANPATDERQFEETLNKDEEADPYVKEAKLLDEFNKEVEDLTRKLEDEEENIDKNRDDAVLKATNPEAEDLIEEEPRGSLNEDAETLLQAANPTEEMNREDEREEAVLREEKPSEKAEPENLNEDEALLRSENLAEEVDSQIEEKGNAEDEGLLKSENLEVDDRFENREDTDETYTGAEKPLEEMENGPENSAEGTPLRAAKPLDEETLEGGTEERNLEDGDDSTLMSVKSEKKLDTEGTEGNIDDENEDQSGETSQISKKDEENENDGTLLRAEHPADEDIGQISEKDAEDHDKDEKDDETPLRAMHSSDKETDQTSEKEARDDDEISLKAANPTDEEAGEILEKADYDYEAAGKAPEKNEDDDTMVRAAEPTNEQTDFEEGDDGTRLQAAGPIDEEARQASGEDVDSGDETPLRSAHPSDVDNETLDVQQEINENVEDKSPLGSANFLESEERSLVDNEENQDEPSLKAAKPSDELKSHTLNEESEDRNILQGANPVEDLEVVDTKPTDQENLKKKGTFFFRPDETQTLEEKLQNLDSNLREPRVGKFKVPKSIGKIMNDLDGKSRDDATSIQNLDPDKIDHFIEKIDRVEQQNVKDSLDDECKKECACADEIDTKARNRGRYEIAKDFLHWMKDLRLNRVLSDD